MLQVQLGEIKIDCCIYNASGPRTGRKSSTRIISFLIPFTYLIGSVEALVKVGSSRSGAILSKSSTLIPQSGNPFPRFVNKIDLGAGNCEGSINSEGICL